MKKRKRKREIERDGEIEIEKERWQQRICKDDKKDQIDILDEYRCVSSEKNKSHKRRRKRNKNAERGGRVTKSEFKTSY